MPEPKPRIYWDACVVLHYIEGSPRWLPALDALLEQASEQRSIEIYIDGVDH